MKSQYVESLVVEVDVLYKPLLKTSELLLLLHHDDKPIGLPQRVEVERMIVSSGEVGRAAFPHVLEVW
jgi:hypothetical protein